MPVKKDMDLTISGLRWAGMIPRRLGEYIGGTVCMDIYVFCHWQRRNEVEDLPQPSIVPTEPLLSREGLTCVAQ